MNLNLNQNQKPEQKLHKSENKRSKQSEKHRHLLEQQGQQQGATIVLQDQHQEKQQLSLAEQPQLIMLNGAGLTAEKLKMYPSLAGLPDLERENIAESLILFSQLTYELFIQQRLVTDCNKDVGVD